MNKAIEIQDWDDHVKVVEEVLTDGSKVYNVHFETADGDTIIFDCEDKAHATRLQACLRDCTDISIALAVDG